ncbi:hypothetical protein ETAA8_25470 [Anatilimnocola aggregata]|uniref:Uncharacterized protein n=1 Tax=Anatilimnocola aggregata TaxID=2528021 RepID=A0A517YBA3_9BACT|nr:hypothetical protein [Anatilimnocola aggregata]QDU27459.1 hypothetical protein ETAA8_25470 [Anatilimnocola aggregata]
MRRRTAQVEAPGQDSFLDVVANLVGILIILVMIVAAQAKRGFIAAEMPVETPAAEIAPLPDVIAATAAANEVEQGIVQIKRNLAAQNLELQIKQQERARLQLLVTVAEQSLEKHRNKLSSEDQQRFDLKSQMDQSLKELLQLDIERMTLEQSRPGNVIPHLPTPMAKTVFGKEIHFRLLGGKIVYLPWDEMIEAMKADLPRQAQKLADTPRAEFGLPIIAGFGAKYILRRFDVDVQTRIAAARQTRIGLERFFFVQVDDPIGETMDQAMRQGSQFRGRLGTVNPQQATVTLWVYPDSFEEFRAVKQELFRLGYLTAGRPLPAGHPIGGSPEGSRSSAE